MTRFEVCLAFVLAREGGFVDDPADHGHATNKGITQGVYDDWCEERGLPAASVRTITDAELRAIYRLKYWLPISADSLPQPLDLVMFDAAVNHGVGAATRMLQAIVGVVVDGSFGPKTLKAALTYLPNKVIAVRREKYRAIVENDPTQAKFAKGWNNRLDDLTAEL